MAFEYPSTDGARREMAGTDAPPAPSPTMRRRKFSVIIEGVELHLAQRPLARSLASKSPLTDKREFRIEKQCKMVIIFMETTCKVGRLLEPHLYFQAFSWILPALTENRPVACFCIDVISQG